MDDNSFEYANFSNLSFIEQLYNKYKEHPEQVDPSWKYFFEGMRLASILPMEKTEVKEQGSSEFRIKSLQSGYRYFGHLAADCNPLVSAQDPSSIEQLNVRSYGELDGAMKTTLEAMQKTYCGKVGYELLHLDKEKQEFITSRIESSHTLHIDKKAILKDLSYAELFESFIHMKYQGQKRFSLEGGEVLIPMLKAILDRAGSYGATECVLGMAHRGRLNVLANLMMKPYMQMFYEFSPGYVPSIEEGSGDVKYHKGYESTISTINGYKIHTQLCTNPSHLEAVGPILEGIAKAKQLLSPKKEEGVIPILIHGDAALAGQGVVYETLQLSQLDGYSTGGTIHLVINNQLGYTTTPEEGRSTRYCTDIVKGFGMPVFHVNGEDPEGCVFVSALALEIREKFKCDVFIDILCYRKYGHSEADEPHFTQPQLYKNIQQRLGVRSIYRDTLIKEGIVSAEEASKLEESIKAEFNQAVEAIAGIKNEPKPKKELQELSHVKTGVSEDVLTTLGMQCCKMPEDLKMHPKIERIFQDRETSLQKKEGIDWGFAETLAYATLLVEGYPVRISGEDVQRGTFAHRHAAIVDSYTEKKYFPLKHINESEGMFSVYNSALSEYAVLGFEFGFASVMPKGLFIWEAQYGDFANTAQVVIDQYIVAAETKWGVKNPLVMLLPHGYEGGGPEHSSARVERYLQQCSDNNMVLAIPTTSAQMFHLLRRHVLWSEKKPLLIFTPKNLLRYPPSLCTLKDLTEGMFYEIFDDLAHKEAKKVMICSGKVYYDLIDERAKRKDESIAIIRIEQLYPLSKETLKTLLESYSKMEKCLWVQEEHSNMGAASYIMPTLREVLSDKVKLCYVGRASSSSPAAGSQALHQKEKIKMLEEAFKEV